MNKLATIAIMAALASPAAASPLTKHGGTVIPAAASAVGYTTNTFHTGSFSTSNIDMNNTYVTGFQWYLTNYFSFAVSPMPSSAAVINADGTVSVQYDNAANVAIMTTGHIPVPPYFVGISFGCGAYITAEISFDPKGVSTPKGWPSWWATSAEHFNNDVGAQWTGQAANYVHIAEIDFFEALRNLVPSSPQQYGHALHEFWGIYNNTCGLIGFCTSTPYLTDVTVPHITDWKLWHRVAILWVPATVSTQGYITSYFDDIRGITNRWDQFTAQLPPPGAGGFPTQPWSFGIIDNLHFPLIFGSGNTPINVRSVDVWQGPGACNLTN